MTRLQCIEYLLNNYEATIWVFGGYSTLHIIRQGPESISRPPNYGLLERKDSRALLLTGCIGIRLPHIVIPELINGQYIYWYQKEVMSGWNRFV